MQSRTHSSYRKATVAALLLLPLLLIMSVRTARAEIHQGASELGANFSSQSFAVDGKPGEAESTVLNLYYGFFPTDKLEVLGDIMIIRNETNLGGGAARESTTTGIELQALYHFVRPRPATPFIGISAGNYRYDDGTNEGSGPAYGLLGGVKYFVSPHTSINIVYSSKSAHVEILGKSETLAVRNLNLGYSIYF